MSLRISLLSAALALPLLGGAAAAQSEPPPAAPEAGGPAAGGPAAGGMAAGRVDNQVADMHRRLRITPAQQPQWEAFVRVLHENAAHAGQLAKARAEAGSKTAVDALRAVAAAAQARAEDAQRLVPVFEALYAAMTPDQQKIADGAIRDFLQRGMRGGPRP